MSTGPSVFFFSRSLEPQLSTHKLFCIHIDQQPFVVVVVFIKEINQNEQIEENSIKLLLKI